MNVCDFFEGRGSNVDNMIGEVAFGSLSGVADVVGFVGKCARYKAVPILRSEDCLEATDCCLHGNILTGRPWI